MNRVNIDNIVEAAEYFYKLAENPTISFDSSLEDSIKRTIGNKVMNDAAQFLNSRAVSSIPVRVEWQKPNATLVVQSTGQDSAAVDRELGALLNKKYAPVVARMLARAKEPAFGFNLLTVE